jgi:CheY-like chemotaxis protein/transcriptional regulator with XRE-family HTH domain
MSARAKDRQLNLRLGTRLRWARLRVGKSQSAAAERLGVSYQQYQKYEKGYSRISAVSLCRLAEVLDFDAGWLLETLESGADEFGSNRHATMQMQVLNSVFDTGEQAQVLAFARRLATNMVGGTDPTFAAGATDPVEAGFRRLAAAGAKRILLVDDDPDVLLISGATLRKAGFEVVASLSGDEALKLTGGPSPFDLLVTDYAMPGLDGAELARLALERQPGLRALIVTGYFRDLRLASLPEGVDILAKPCTRIEFIQKIDSLIARRKIVL